jgi:uncharacterized SAM-binding protein YcdF (DUF218 family)
MMVTVDSLAKIIWNYHLLHHKLCKADLILVLGSNDSRVAEYGAQLFLKEWAPLIMFSQGIAHNADSLKTPWKIAEADYFAKIAIRKGVPRNKIIIENKSTNTGENIDFSRTILRQRKLNIRRIIIVQKPYMERRAYATFKKRWSSMAVIVTSPPISLDAYPTKDISKEKLINLIVGDLQRIRIYAKKGFQIRQAIPRNVWRAYEELVKKGYTKHVVKE